jgi:DNA-binding transcriptional MerR regulator
VAKAAEAFRTISEVAEELGVPKHVLRFWELKFPHVRPMKRGGGRRYYRPEDLDLLRGIRHLLHNEGYTIRGVQKILRLQGVDRVKQCWLASAERIERAEPVAAGGGARGPRGAKSLRPEPSEQTPAPPAPLGPALRTVVAAIIAELEFCRAQLAGGPARRSKGGGGPRQRATR